MSQVVQDTKAEMAERNDELLSSFNVATFKSDEDDQAFWNRLIPVDQRAKEQTDVHENLGIRSARLSKFADDVRPLSPVLACFTTRMMRGGLFVSADQTVVLADVSHVRVVYIASGAQLCIRKAVKCRLADVHAHPGSSSVHSPSVAT